MQTRFHHVLLTRFNVRVSYAPRPTHDWLHHRVTLFEKFCLPSVAEQTCQDFTWIICFDEESREFFHDKLLEYRKYVKIIPLFFRGKFSLYKIRRCLRSLVCGYDYMISTRLDNDDAICLEYVESIQNVFRPIDGLAVNFPSGFVWHEGRAFELQLFNNPFLSLIESTCSCRTVWCRNHPDLKDIVRVVQVNHQPAWLQVVHGRNVSNSVRGKQTDFSLHSSRFPNLSFEREIAYGGGCIRQGERTQECWKRRAASI